MINPETFTAEHIRQVQQQSKRDPALIERVIYAFGLLEAITRSGLPFIFKGGTSLMLLLDEPRRFSTDIDVIVKPGTNVDEYLATTAEIWPFIKINEHTRKKSGNIEKRHFKFSYISPINSREQTILLDIVYEENPYSSVVDRIISNEFLLIDSPNTTVRVPDANCIIADKLTAFAPHTTGIPFGADKEMEIIKQLYDIALLLDLIDDFDEVKSNYHRIVDTEASYRGISINTEDVLRDTIQTATCIAGRGLYRADEYQLLKKGISNLRNHIIYENFNGEVAVQRACMVIYLAAAITANKDELPTLREDEYYIKENIQMDEFKKLNYIKKMDILAYKYLFEATNMLIQCTAF